MRRPGQRFGKLALSAVDTVGNQEFGGTSGSSCSSLVFERQGVVIRGTRKKSRKEHFTRKLWFNLLIGLLICVSVTLVGVELDFGPGFTLEDRFGFFVVDLVFTAIFFVEMLLRQSHEGWNYFVDPWNLFDYGLVVVNCADIAQSVHYPTSSGAKVATGLRLVRLMRAARYAEGLAPLAPMYLVLQGLVDSVRTMAWIGIFLLMNIYVFAVILMTVADTEAVRETFGGTYPYIGSVFNAMITTFQVVTLDGWASEVARPMMLSSGNWLIGVVFVIAIVVCNWGILNLIIALMVERVSTMKAEMVEKNGKNLAGVENTLFASLARDFVGENSEHGFETERWYTHREYAKLIRTPKVSHKLRLLGYHLDEAESLFPLLDVDGRGRLPWQDIVRGLRKAHGIARNADLCAFISFAQKHSTMARDNTRTIRKLLGRADAIQERLNVIGRKMDLEISSRNAHKKRTEEMWEQAAVCVSIIESMQKGKVVSFPDVTPSKF